MYTPRNWSIKHYYCLLATERNDKRTDTIDRHFFKTLSYINNAGILETNSSRIHVYMAFLHT